MATPPTAATRSGDLGPPVETSPTTRSTDNVERTLARAPEQPGRVDRARQLRLTPRNAPLCERATTCATDSAAIGLPQRSEGERGLAEAHTLELTPPTKGQPDSAPPHERARSREVDADVLQMTPMRGQPDAFFRRPSD